MIFNSSLTTMDMEYSFSQTFGRGLLRNVSPNCKKSGFSAHSHQSRLSQHKNFKLIDENEVGKENCFLNKEKDYKKIDELSDRMQRLLQELRNQNNTNRINFHNNPSLPSRSKSQIELKRPSTNLSNQSSFSSKKQSVAPLSQNKNFHNLQNKISHSLQLQQKSAKHSMNDIKLKYSHQMDRNQKEKLDEGYPVSLMKGKVKTIESESGEFMEIMGSERESLEITSKSSATSDVYKRFVCFGSNNKKDVDYGWMKVKSQHERDHQSPHQSIHHNPHQSSSGTEFEQKIRQISQKIDDYQRKVSHIPDSNYQSRSSSRRESFKQQSERFEKYEEYEPKYIEERNSHNFSHDDEEVRKILEKYRSHTREENNDGSAAKHCKIKTPTWNKNESLEQEQEQKQQSERNSRTDESMYQSNHKLQFNESKEKQSLFKYEPKDIYQRGELDRQESYQRRDLYDIRRQQIQKLSNIDLQKSKKSGVEFGNLRERMAEKINLEKVQKTLNKQISLDEDLRKAKKDFSKLPDVIGHFDKWDVLSRELESMCISMSHEELLETFFLSDDEADPFYSIQIENLSEFQNIIEKTVMIYLRSEEHFAESVFCSFSPNEVNQLLVSEDAGQIRLDEFTIMTSEWTKSSLMCRDTAILFKRFYRASGDNRLSWRGLKRCLLQVR